MADLLASDTFAVLGDGLAKGVYTAAAASIGDLGQPLVEHAIGTCALDDASPCTPATYFDLASVTKPMATAAVAMAMVSEGTLSLATPVARYFAGIDARMTVKHLLGHAAGFPAHIEFFRAIWQGERYGATTTRQALVNGASSYPLAYAPGEKTIYSDLGFITLGALLERAANMSLDRAFAHYVAEPLGLVSARYVAHDQGESLGTRDVAATEIDDRRGTVRGEVHDENCHSGGGVAGHAGLFARLADVTTFARAMCALGNDADQGRIHSAVAKEFFAVSAAPNTSWRLGWDTPASAPGVSHAGDLWPREHAVGHLGFTGTSIWLDLPRQRWAILLTNRVHPSRVGERAAAIKDIRRAFADAVILGT